MVKLAISMLFTFVECRHPARRTLLGLVLGLALAGRLSAATPEAQAQIDEVPVGKSVFIDEPTFGKDPFFPKSDRRPKVAKPPTTGEAALAALADAAFNSLSLKGISGLKEKRLALINNYTLETGEEADIKVNGQPIKVRCLEIRERSVLVSVRGQTKELFLRQGL